MSNPIRLELSSLPQRHPRCGRALQRTYGEAATVRLSIDPVRLAAGVEECEVIFAHTAVGTTPTRELRGLVCWATLFAADGLEELSITMSADTLTEFGAIALAALTVSEFEKAEIVQVLAKGSGGDYLIEVGWRPHPVQMEVSGVLGDDSPTGAKTASPVAEKCEQVLTRAREGFVSVTAFDHRSGGGPYSFLGYVTRATMAAQG